MKQNNNNNVSDFPEKTGSVDGPETGRDWNHYQAWNLAYWGVWRVQQQLLFIVDLMYVIVVAHT